MKEINKDKLVRRYMHKLIFNIKSIFYFSRSSWASIASRTFGWRSGNIANSSESENCQDNFQDLQKDLVVLSYLMLLFWPLRRASRQLSYEESLFVGRGRRLRRPVAERSLTQNLSFQERWLRNVCFANLPLSEAKQVCRRRGLFAFVYIQHTKRLRG